MMEFLEPIAGRVDEAFGGFQKLGGAGSAEDERTVSLQKFNAHASCRV